MEETIDGKITRLTAFWYEYVSIDHHKDRDCHFYITKHWAYGDAPTYSAHHEGYIAERWHGPERKTHGEAQRDLLKFLEGEVSSAVKTAHYEDPEDYWATQDTEHARKIAKKYGLLEQD